MAVAAEAVIPHPLIVDAVVDVDIPSRTLAVRLSELEQGETVGFGRMRIRR